jgi:hypothetical protein
LAQSTVHEARSPGRRLIAACERCAVRAGTVLGNEFDGLMISVRFLLLFVRMDAIIL